MLEFMSHFGEREERISRHYVNIDKNMCVYEEIYNNLAEILIALCDACV